MADFYGNLILVGRRLIAQRGQDMILRRPVGVMDPDMPWRATSTSFTDEAVRGVLLTRGVERPEGKKVARDDRIVIISSVGLSAPITPEVLVVIGGVEHSVQNPVELAPGGQSILWQVLVRQWPLRSDS